jgi:hypothetical protein
MAPLQDSEYCWAHDPASAVQRAKARRLGGKNRRTPAAVLPNGPITLRDVANIQVVLEGAVTDTLVQSNSSQRSRTLGYLLGIALDAIERGTLEERVGALEKQLAESRGPRRIA